MVTTAMKLKDSYSWNESYDKPRQYINKQKHYFADRGPYSQSYVFSTSHVLMWEMDNEKVECWRIDAFELCAGEDSSESPGLQGDQTSKS